MPRKVLILLHGIGVHTGQSFKENVLKGIDKGLQRYPGYGDKGFEELFEKENIHSIEYDNFFNAARERLKNEGGIVSSFITNNLKGVKLPNIIPKLAALESSFGDDKFFNTHALDVLFYLTILGEQVRGSVMEDITNVFKKYSLETEVEYHFLSHSLGTSVMHDCLTKLFTLDTGSTLGRLKVGHPKINTYWTFANVSRLVTTFSGLSGPFETVVKPGSKGVTSMFYNIYNEFDPIAFDIFRRFDPDNSNNWIPENVFKYQYEKIVTKDVTQKDTHAIDGYLEDPKVTYPFLRALINDFNPSEDQKNEADGKFQSIQTEFEQIKNFKLKHAKTVDLVTFIKMLKAFNKYITEDLQ